MPLAEPERPRKMLPPPMTRAKFHAHVEQSADLLADGAHGFGVDTGFLLSGQGLAAQLEQHALVLEFSHMFRLG